MPKRDIGLARLANRRNEYLMFVAPEVEISEDATKWLQLNSLLWLPLCMLIILRKILPFLTQLIWG